MAERSATSEWAEARSLLDVAGKPQYGWTTSARRGSGVKLLRTTDITSGQIQWDSVPVCQTPPDDLSKYALGPGDILVSRAGSVGFSSLIDESCPPNAVFASYLMRIRPKRDVIRPRFLAHYMKSPDYWEKIGRASVGIGLANVNGSKLSAMTVPVPSLEEQDFVIAILDQFVSDRATVLTHLDLAKRAAERLRESILAAACSGDLTRGWRDSNAGSSAGLIEELERNHAAAGVRERRPKVIEASVSEIDPSALPSSWSVAPLKLLCDPTRPITYGILKPGPDVEDGVPYVRVTDFKTGEVITTSIRRTSPQIATEYRRSALRAGDLLFAIRGTYGLVAFVPTELDGGNITQDTARLSIHPLMSARFVRFVLQSPEVKARIRRAAKGVAVQGVNLGDLRELLLPVPPRAEQDEIVRRVDELLTLAKNLDSRIASARNRVNRTAAALFSTAFRGELTLNGAKGSNA